MSNRTSRDEAVDTQPVQYGFSQEAEISLGWLRDRIDFPMTMFGAAYLGYVGGLFEEGFEAGFPSWLWENLADGIIDREEYARLKQNYAGRCAECEKQMEALQETITQIKEHGAASTGSGSRPPTS